MTPNFNDIAVAFSDDDKSDVITWHYAKDSTITIEYGDMNFVSVRQGNYSGRWPQTEVPPRFRYLRATLDHYHWHTFSQHPTAECNVKHDTIFCPVCTERESYRQIFLYLLCINTRSDIIRPLSSYHGLRKLRKCFGTKI